MIDKLKKERLKIEQELAYYAADSNNEEAIKLKQRLRWILDELSKVHASSY